MSIITNWDVYTQRNWDSKGREKLIKGLDKIIEDFSETTIGSQILNNITALQNQVLSLNQNAPQYWSTGDDIALSSNDNTDVNLGISFNSVGWSYKDLLITGQVLIEPTEAAFGLSINTSTPPTDVGGFSRLLDYDTGGTISEDHGSGGISLLSTGVVATTALWEFSYLVRIENLTTFTLRATDVGGSLGMGSWVKAVLADGVPIIPGG